MIPNHLLLEVVIHSQRTMHMSEHAVSGTPQSQAILCSTTLSDAGAATMLQADCKSQTAVRHDHTGM